jgi:CMP-N-acetylneuraminic acid synthetase
MNENKKIGVYIPGRLKSERLPNKLILPLGDKCLWDMACEKLNDLPNKYNKYVLCCDKELITIAEKYPNLQIIQRQKHTAEVDEPLDYIFQDLKGCEDTHLMFLNPCLSLLKPETILKSLEHFENSECDSATSVKIYKNWLWNQTLSNLTPMDRKTLSTKSIPVHFEAAHCFHIFNRSRFFETGEMLDKYHDLILIDKSELMDVDDMVDYEYACFIFEKKQ